MSRNQIVVKSLPDLVQKDYVIDKDVVRYRFGNDLTIETELFSKADPNRILPLGNPQAALMNHILSFPEKVLGKRVFEPFAGSGPLGFMALQIGAESVDFLDINPRAVSFQHRNAALNGFGPDRYRSFESDIDTHGFDRKYDLVLANPPFVPTPPGLKGVITSNGGADGNRFVKSLLRRLDDLLEPTGTALVYAMQLTMGDEPLVSRLGRRLLPQRSAVITPAQENPLPFSELVSAYKEVFPSSVQAIEQWRVDTTNRFGQELSVDHYVIEIGPKQSGEPRWAVLDNFPSKYGSDFWVPTNDLPKLAVARAMENLVQG